MSTLRPDFPLVFDNTMRSTFVTCPRKFAYEFLDHWKPAQPNVHLHAGAAWASALECTRLAYYVQRLPAPEAIAAGVAHFINAYGDFVCPPESAKSRERMVDAFVYYFERYPLTTDPCQPYIGPHGPMIEFSFVEPLDDTLLHPVTGDPILYSGRADMIATYAGAVSIFDDKTTSSLGASWAGQWDMRSQFTGYAWAATRYGIPVTQVVVRGISILKTKFETAQAISHRDDWRIERWRQQVVRDIRRCIAAWEEGYFDIVEADACSSYGGCPFKQPCMSRNPQPWLETAFVRRRWDPVTREEVVL
jgi:hypothetical protein